MAGWGQPRLERTFRDFVDQAPLAIVITTAEGQIAATNREAESLFGYSREELLGKPIEVLMPMRFRQGHVSLRDHYVRDPEAPSLMAAREISALRSDGREFPVEIHLKRMATPEGLFVFSTIVDITNRKRNECQATAEAIADRTTVLSEANAVLQRSNLDLQQFAYIASHDLQEPLRKMASFSELLQKKYSGQLDEDGERYIHYIVDGALRMRTMIRDLLSFARLEQQPVKATKQSLNQVVDAAFENLATNIQETGASVTRDELPDAVVDPDLVTQVFQNLIANAIKFRRAEVPPRVHISAASKGAGWTISVRDNGLGIEPQYFEQIFLAFKRLHSHAQIPGTGIGLAICRQIVERHGGTLTLESTPGEGSVFIVYIPQQGVLSHESVASESAPAHG
jgi:PAS domain S-box-containing protein